MAFYLFNKHSTCSRPCVWRLEYECDPPQDIVSKKENRTKWQLQTTGQCDKFEKWEIRTWEKGRRKCLTVSLGQAVLEVRDRFHKSGSRNMDQKVLQPQPVKTPVETFILEMSHLSESSIKAQQECIQHWANNRHIINICYLIWWGDITVSGCYYIVNHQIICVT